MAPSAPLVNHLLSADDSMLFFKASVQETEEVSNLLDTYCKASGQRINCSKSSIYFSKGDPKSARTLVKNTRNVQNETLTEMYLGMPSDVAAQRMGLFKYLKDRVWNKVKGCLQKILSAGGKDVQIIAQAIPDYSMACFRLPRGLCEHINSIIHKFWWGSKNGERKPHWVSWDVMTMPKFMGGLGFRELELFKLALLACRSWRIIQDPNSFSARILKAVYFPNSSILEARLGSHPSQIWRAIIDGRDVLAQGIMKRIGDCRSTRIWEDNLLPRDNMLGPLKSRVAEAPQYEHQIIDHTSASWKEDMIRDIFLPMDAATILAIPLCTSNA